MDKINKKLLYALSKNSRESIRKLSKTIRLGDSSTFYRLESLAATKIIQNYQCIIDNSLLGYKGFRLYFSFTKTTLAIEHEIFQWLASQESVSVLAHCYGGIDVAVMSWVLDELHFYSLFHELKKKWGKYLRNLDLFIYLKTAHFARSYLLNKNSEYLFTTGLSKDVPFDKLDMHILQLLSNNARESALSLSTKCNVSAKTVIERIRRLEQKRIIAGYGVGIDALKASKQYFKLNIVLDEPLDESKIVSFASSVPGVVYIDFTLGRFDIELNLEVDSYEDVAVIMDQLKQINSTVTYSEVFQIKKYYKLRFI